MQIPPIDYNPLQTKPVNNKGLMYAIPAKQTLLVTAVLVTLAYVAAPLVYKTPLAMLLLIAGLTLVIIKILNDNKLRQAKIVAFVAANSITHQQEVLNPNYPGMFFNAGHSRIIRESYTIKTDGHPIEAGNYTYTTGHGKNRNNRMIGYMRLKLPRRLPNMLLDSRANNVLGRNIGTFPIQLDSSQKLQLEGDFNKYFTLYAPKQYERDALYVFTPDIMAALVDNASNYDVEIVDDDIFIYCLAPFDFASVNIWQKLLAIASKISPELEEQTDYYSDERVADRQLNQIAEPGKRLKSGFSWTVAVAIVVYASINICQGIIASRGDKSLTILIEASIIILFWGTFAFVVRRVYKQHKNRS